MSSVKLITAHLDISTRGKRRKTVLRIIDLLKQIREAEENYMANIPLNLQSGDAYMAADESVDAIIDAVSYLEDAY